MTERPIQSESIYWEDIGKRGKKILVHSMVSLAGLFGESPNSGQLERCLLTTYK